MKCSIKLSADKFVVWFLKSGWSLAFAEFILWLYWKDAGSEGKWVQYEQGIAVYYYSGIFWSAVCKC